MYKYMQFRISYTHLRISENYLLTELKEFVFIQIFIQVFDQLNTYTRIQI